MKLPRIAYITIAVACTFLALKFNLIGSSGSICEVALTLSHISCGEKMLLNSTGSLPRYDKQAGFEAIKNKDLPTAIKKLEKDWSFAKDPETLIGLENTRLLQKPSAQVKTIAAVVPIRNSPIFLATSILKGIAEAQREWNAANHNYMIRIVLADDGNDPVEANKIANELVKDPDILAVFGHYSSNVTSAVKDVYQKARVVLFSATSTSDELSANNSDNFFFRNVSSTNVASKDMAIWARRFDKIALFYTPNKGFSESTRKAFLAKISPGQVIKEFYLSSPENAEKEIATVKALGTKAIAIFADAYTDPIERDRVLSIVKANKGQIPILGSSILRDSYLFQIDPQFLKTLTISVPIHPSNRRFIDMARLNKSPDWWGNKYQLHDRIINSYDALQVLLTALEQANDRASVQKVISHPGFIAYGITGKISFRGSDRGEDINSLITPSCQANKCDEFKIVS